jgi:hypothetical protein
MRRPILLVVLMVQSCLPLCAKNKDNGEKMIYAEKGIWEIAGSGSFTVNFYNENKEYDIDLTPGIAYFVRDRVHIGLKNMLIYTIRSSDISGKWHHFYDYVGFLSAGYVCKVQQKLCLDFMADYGISIAQSDERRYYVLISAIKYDLDRALLVLNVTYKYIDYDQESLIKDYSMLQLGVGFSIYLGAGTE